MSQRYHTLLADIDNQRLWKPRLQLIRQGMDIENEFIKVLVEDDTFGLTNYVDHLCLIHKRIQTELERDKHENYMASTSYWAHRY
jgi:protein transport protein SEC24